jgi:hypothetical protein
MNKQTKQFLDAIPDDTKYSVDNVFSNAELAYEKAKFPKKLYLELSERNISKNLEQIKTSKAKIDEKVTTAFMMGAIVG